MTNDFEKRLAIRLKRQKNNVLSTLRSVECVGYKDIVSYKNDGNIYAVNECMNRVRDDIIERFEDFYEERRKTNYPVSMPQARIFVIYDDVEFHITNE